MDIFFSLYITAAGWLANISSPVFGLLWAGKIGKLYVGHICNSLCEPFICIVFIHLWSKCLCSIYRITFLRWVAFSLVYFKLWAYLPVSCFLCLSILNMDTNDICSSLSWMLDTQTAVQVNRKYIYQRQRLPGPTSSTFRTTIQSLSHTYTHIMLFSVFHLVFHFLSWFSIVLAFETEVVQMHIVLYCYVNVKRCHIKWMQLVMQNSETRPHLTHTRWRTS